MNQVFLLFETARHRILPDRPHDRPKSSLLKARVVILLLALLPPCRILKLHLMVTAVTAAPAFPPQTSPSMFVRMRYSRALATFSVRKLSSMHSRNCLNCLSPAVLSLQQTPGWLKSPARTRAWEIQTSSSGLKTLHYNTTHISVPAHPDPKSLGWLRTLFQAGYYSIPK